MEYVQFRRWKGKTTSRQPVPISSPKYYRGPLHPVQMPAPSDPTARDFKPGPFNVPRLRHTYDGTIAPDILTLTYQHKVPGEAVAESKKASSGNGMAPRRTTRIVLGEDLEAEVHPDWASWSGTSTSTTSRRLRPSQSILMPRWRLRTRSICK
uniref:Uncharacterized protein n=1 Tax=Bionectria ochroleuca TaxID=29856 RepID=A0A8H7TSU8_BIOOC